MRGRRSWACRRGSPGNLGCQGFARKGRTASRRDEGRGLSFWNSASPWMMPTSTEMRRVTFSSINRIQFPGHESDRNLTIIHSAPSWARSPLHKKSPRIGLSWAKPSLGRVPPDRHFSSRSGRVTGGGLLGRLRSCLVVGPFLGRVPGRRIFLLGGRRWHPGWGSGYPCMLAGIG